jgi:hypothetical protein
MTLEGILRPSPLLFLSLYSHNEVMNLLYYLLPSCYTVLPKAQKKMGQPTMD